MTQIGPCSSNRPAATTDLHLSAGEDGDGERATCVEGGEGDGEPVHALEPKLAARTLRALGRATKRHGAEFGEVAHLSNSNSSAPAVVTMNVFLSWAGARSSTLMSRSS